MSKFKVMSPLRHNKKKYKEGDTITLEQAEATDLLELKVIMPVGGSIESEMPDEDPMVLTKVSGTDSTKVDAKKAPPSSAKVQLEKTDE